MGGRKFSSALLGAVLAVVMPFCIAPMAMGFSFDEVEKLDKVEATELLSRAREAASSGNTSSARSFIAQARAKGATPAQIKPAQSAVAQAEHRADQARREQEARDQAQAAAANRPSGGGATGGNGRGYVLVEADCVTGTPCDVSNLTIGNGPGRFESAWRAARSGAIHQGSSGLAGQYSYAFTIEKGGRRCVATGSFSVDGSIGDVKLNHYPDCRLASVHGF